MLIPEALDILLATNEKIQSLGAEVVDSDLQDSPKLPRLRTQLKDLVVRYTMLLKFIILNDDGDEILGTMGTNDDDLNAILIDLQTIAQLNNLPGAPIPRVTYVVSGSGGGNIPSSGSLGDLLYYNGTGWINFSKGASGEVLVSTPSTIQWQSVVGNGIPSGGTTGQFLRKNNNDDYIVVWADATLADVGVTASPAEVNILGGATFTTTEANKLTGLTGGSLETQLASKLSTSLAVACIIIGSALGVATPVDTSAAGDILAHSVNGLTIKSGVIDNDNIGSGAAIERSKLANGSSYRVVINNGTGVMDQASAITAARVVISDANGIPTHHPTVTPTTLGYLDVVSSVQASLDERLVVSLTGTAQGDILYYNGTNWVNVAIGTSGQVLKSNGTDVVWGAATANGLPSGGTADQFLVKVDGTDYNSGWQTFVLTYVTDVSATAAELNQLAGVVVTPTEFNFVAGVTSSIQTQFTSKLDRSLAYNAMFVGNGSGIASQLSPGTNGYILTMVGGSPVWQPATPPGDVSGPVSSTDRAIATWNGVAGDALRDTSVLIDASNNITGVTSLSSGQISVLNQSELRLYETGSTNYVGLRATGVMAGNYTITLPAAAPASNTFLKYDGADYVWAAGGGGAGAFTDLTDVPTSYTGEAGKFVVVKGAEDGLEFITGGFVTSVSGTTDRISISGTASAPIVDIAATYVGQASITTLGTIGTGTWNATNISLAKGGTGTTLADPGADRIMFWDESGNVVNWLSVDSTLSITGTTLSSVFGDAQAQAAVGGILNNTTTINLTYNGGGPTITADVNTNSISDTLIRQSVALSVIGRSANSTGNVADISAGADHNILRRSGVTIGFGAIDLSQAGAVGSSILPIANGGSGSATNTAWLLASGGTLTGPNTITQPVSTSGSPVAITFVGGAHTTLTASTEASDWVYNLARTVQFSTGAIASQRAVKFLAPTYSAVGASVITDGAVISISGNPIAGTNVSYTRPSALLIESGAVRIRKDNLGVTHSEVDGIVLENNTDASAVLNQYSTAIRFVASGWKTNATAGPQKVEFVNDVSTTIAAAAPTGSWRLRSRVNGGALTTIFAVQDNGSVTFSGTLTIGGIINNTATGYINSANNFPVGSAYTMYTSSGSLNPTGPGTTTITGVFNVVNNYNGASATIDATSFNSSPTVGASGMGTLIGFRHNPTLTGAAATNYAFISSSGLHGFGTLTPTYLVQIKGTANNQNLFVVQENGGTNVIEVIENGGVNKLGIWGVAPDAQPTNAIAAAAFVANTSGIADDTATWGGYTNGQIVAALKRIGLIA